MKKSSGRHAIGRCFLAALCALGLYAPIVWARESKPIRLGLTSESADRFNTEFQQYDRMTAVYRENGIQAALLEKSVFHVRDCSEAELLATLKQFHVVHLSMGEEGHKRFTAADKKRVAIVGRALARYVADGGGLFLQLRVCNYPGDENELYWNALLAPFGTQSLHEGVFDNTHTLEGTTLPDQKVLFWHTTNIERHPITEGVRCLYLPLHGCGNSAGMLAMRYSPEWKILVRGHAEARSYQCARDTADMPIQLDAPGSYAAAPPVLAVRELGKGRVVCYPISQLFTGINHRNPLWADIVESNGDRAAERPSDSMKMQMNAYRWLAEPSRSLADYGSYVPPVYRPVGFPARIDRDQPQFATPRAGGVRGLFGAHSAYSDGSGTVTEFVEAAKAAGLSFLVFADPLEKLSKDKLRRLKADCAAASQGGDFYACPGVEFSDGLGNRWALWGPTVVWPRASFDNGHGTVQYVQWDGQRIHHYGEYVMSCDGAGCGLLDYAQLRRNGAHAENLWWFFYYFPLVYEKDRLIADNRHDFLFGLRDMRWPAVAAFTRVRAPGDVAAAAGACFTGVQDLPSARNVLNTSFSLYGAAFAAGQYLSQGPVIAAWRAIGSDMLNWRNTRGVQRIRLRFVVRSDAGIAEVKVLDADRGPLRRFLGGGAKEFSREFELVHDQQHYLVLEVTDSAGKTAISHEIMAYCYKAGLYRCGDNLNILGPTAMVWHPDRNEMFPAAKMFRNGLNYTLRGYDYGGTTLGVPAPEARLWDTVNLQEVQGWSPNLSQTVVGRLMDVGVNSYDLQIATMRMTKLSERCDSPTRPTPALASVARDLGDIEYFDRTHTLYAPMERVDMFVAWDYRRDRESQKDYRGGILWHEGEIRFKEDCTLRGGVPIPLVWDRCPLDLTQNIGATAIVTDADGSTRVGLVRDAKTPVRLQGRIRPGGYAALMTTPVGYHGLLVPADMDFAYQITQPSWSGLTAGLGRDGRKIAAGTVLKYRFGVGTFADEAAGNALLEHTVKAMNFSGGHSGYPVAMKIGEVLDATFFFTAQAEKNEALFKLGPQQLLIDLPIRVRKLSGNGCVAVWSSKRPWFRFVPVDAEQTAWLQEPIDQENELWVGNVFVCDNKAVKITLVVDGQAEGKPPFVELHNPTDKEIGTTVHSPTHTPLFGGISISLKLPPGDSKRVTLHGKGI